MPPLSSPPLVSHLRTLWKTFESVKSCQKTSKSFYHATIGESFENCNQSWVIFLENIWEPKTLQSFYNVTTVLTTIYLSIMHAWVVPFAKTFENHLISHQNITILQSHQTHHHEEPFLCKIILLNKLCVCPHVCQTFTFFIFNWQKLTYFKFAKS